MQEQAERPQARTTPDRQSADTAPPAPDNDFVVRAPSLSLPKGGGAIRGMGEKFAANPVTGTASMSVPIYASPGRSGFGPQLSLSYDSGAGNGPFGFGWNLSLPSITRKTDKGLPLYRDAEESDVYILSGAEDLVPVLNDDGSRYEDDQTFPGFVVHRYRPRIEELFARIERWTRTSDGEIRWRSISRDNVTTWYGKTNESRITDPEEPMARVFSWLICQSYDDKGNAIVYEYASENSAGIDLSSAHERNRTDTTRSANRYLKRIKYGNVKPNRAPDNWEPQDPKDPAVLGDGDWLFEVVFDYGEGHFEDLPLDSNRPAAGQHQYANASAAAPSPWPARADPFSSYRAGFEVRTYRLCRRVLMFHHFPDELGVDGYLVRSTELAYEEGPIASFLTSVTQSGFVRQADSNSNTSLLGSLIGFVISLVTTSGNASPSSAYLKRSLPPLEFEYSKADIDKTVQDVDAESLENLPIGLDGSTYQWVDLDGEGLSGILTEQAGGWYYKRNLSPLPIKDGAGNEVTRARFGPLETVGSIPSLAQPGGRHRFLDLAGDGRQDVALMERPVSGFYERTDDEGWDPFRNFLSCPNVDWGDPNLRFVDLTGDGHADILITEHEAFTWYPSRAEKGFGPAERAWQALDEETGPKLLFADGTQSIYLADLSGDGLTDLARIRNGEVCYWPNLGYGRFGLKVTMDNSPRFDRPDQFSQQRIRLADIDGSGTTDILYLRHDCVDIYRNECGNRWTDLQALTAFPRIDNLSSVMAIDLRGNGTACLVWSSPLPGDTSRQMRYIDLMGDQKPHLLERVDNNLGGRTSVTYAPSTKFYLQDRRDGRPWITRIPFPVHVVERVQTEDLVSRNRFVTRYKYHHGYFDGVEREFRGFGMVEQWDTEEFAALSDGGELTEPTNIDEASHVPPVLTRTWFHTGSYLQRLGISRHFEAEYYQGDPNAELLPDTILPLGLTVEEEREACRALKGSMLRQEVYARDRTDKQERPYTVTEQNFTIEVLQARSDNRHPVFFTHPREAINYHYERNPADPRISHALTIEVDDYGNVRKTLAIGYGRLQSPLAEQEDRDKQTKTLITYTENLFTNEIDDTNLYPDDYRTPLPAETRTFELTGFAPENNAARFSFDEWWRNGFALLSSAAEIPYEQPADGLTPQRRLIEHVRTLYRPDNLGEDLGNPPGDALILLPLGQIQSMALPGEAYKLAFTPGLLVQVYRRVPEGARPENLLNPGDILPLDVADPDDPKVADRGGYVSSESLRSLNLFPADNADAHWTRSDADGHWWIPSGRSFFSPGSNDAPSVERDHARANFFLPHRYRDPFHTDAARTETVVTYDSHKLLVKESRDALSNIVTADTEDDANITETRIDYRVLQPYWLTDPNGNRTRVAFDALGLVTSTAVMGKPGEELGDRLDGFAPDLTQAEIDGFYDDADPHGPAEALLVDATTRIVYDLDRFRRTRQAEPEDPTQWQPASAATIARETHVSDPLPPHGFRTQIGFSYSDGFGREIQKNVQAEPGPVDGHVGDVDPRWVGTGWTVFNNKGKPVRQFEPFFSATHKFEFGAEHGVSPILFYDPVERVVATLHPNHTYEKVDFGPWGQTTWDVNDTVTFDPRSDNDLRVFLIKPDDTPRLPEDKYLPTWHQLRTDPAHAGKFEERYPDATVRQNQTQAAEKAAAHADTPTVAHFDSLGRPFLSVADNGPDGEYETRTILDIEGNQRRVRDAVTDAVDENRDPATDPLGRIVMQYDYDMLGNRIHQASMEAGERWMLNDVAGNPIRAWDSRGFMRRMTYDQLRRPTGLYVTENGAERLAEQTEYGEGHADALALNLRTRVFTSHDGAGIVTNTGYNALTGKDEGYDFKGNPLRAARQLVADYKGVPDWSGAPATDPGSFVSSTTYDALNRPVTATSPDGSVYRATFNEANLLDKVDVNLRGAAAATPFVTNIDYDAKGQRKRIEYGNAATTTYDYDPLTFRLMHMRTTRPAGLNGTAAEIFVAPTVVQDLRYTYDPIGNITRIEDASLKSVNYGGQDVHPVCNYEYDALYRLTKAEGREHIGQNAFFSPLDNNQRDFPFVGHVHPNDLQAQRKYTQHYEYDAVGNFEVLRHVANGGDWTRLYDYEEDSLLEKDTKKSNRLTRTTVNGVPEQYRYEDPAGLHGNITFMKHLELMEWDYRDQLRATARQRRTDGGTPETTWYVYDASGQRVRKVTERQAAPGDDPTRMKERIYLGGFEIHREYNGDGTKKTLERETLHIMDDKQRIAMVETRTDTPAPEQLIRYQFGNHLGSASIELAENGALISYEEYHPYGTSAFQAGRSAAEVSSRRYRYTGKERDEESGFYYHGARYYAPWIGRWTSCDPAWLSDGPNLYLYVKDNPIRLRDPSGNNAFEDLALFIRNQAGFEQGARTPPTFNSSSASPFGTAAHKTATGVVEEMQKIGFVNADRVISEPVIVNDVITSAGSGPAGAPKGALAPDLLFTKQGTQGSVVGQKASAVAQELGDLKFGGGKAAPKYSQVGVPVRTVNGVTNSAATNPALVQLAAPETPSTVASAGKVVAAEAAAETSLAARSVGLLKNVGKGLLVAGAVAGALLGGVQVGQGVNQIIEGKKALGTIDVAEGGVNLGLSIGTTAAVSSGALVAETGVAAGGLTVAAGLAAAGGVALAAETARAAVRGEETPLEIADNFYNTKENLGFEFSDLVPEQSATEDTIYDKLYRWGIRF